MAALLSKRVALGRLTASQVGDEEVVSSLSERFRMPVELEYDPTGCGSVCLDETHRHYRIVVDDLIIHFQNT